MASQRFKDDGSGRMVSSFISDLFGMLWVDEKDMKKVNANRARKNKLPISFGVVCSLEGENLDPDYSTHLDLELSMLNAERASRGEEPLNSNWGSSSVRFDYGKNREGCWKAAHMIEHADEFLDILEVCFPDVQHLFIFDNSSGHGAFADDALLAQRMSKGWGGKQPKMHSTCWTDSEGNMHVQSMVFEVGDADPVSKCAARKEPDTHIGCAKGLHQVLCERKIVESLLVAAAATRTDREEKIMGVLEEEGRMAYTDPGKWNGTCGSCNEDLPAAIEGCDKGIDETDDSKRCLLLCTYCLNAYHPGCAGLCPTIRRLKDDWACPECVWEAENVLKLDPLHLSPA